MYRCTLANSFIISFSTSIYYSILSFTTGYGPVTQILSVPSCVTPTSHIIIVPAVIQGCISTSDRSNHDNHHNAYRLQIHKVHPSTICEASQGKIQRCSLRTQPTLLLVHRGPSRPLYRRESNRSETTMCENHLRQNHLNAARICNSG